MSVDSAVAERVRAACEPIHPSAVLRDAVLRDLGPQAPATRWRRPALGAAIAAGVLVGVGAAWFGGWFARDGGPAPVPAAPTDAKPDLAAIATERAANLALYEKQKAKITFENDGMWVSITHGSTLVFGNTLESVLVPSDPTKPAPKHRFVFQAGEEGDKEEFVSTWYAPRFAGMGLGSALGVEIRLGDGITLSKGHESIDFDREPTPFPRLRLEIGAPNDKPGSAEAPRRLEVFLGTVGPTLMLTPLDDARLGLERWEVPGRHVVGGVPCRRVLVKVALRDFEAEAVVVAAVPDVPYERLVAMARNRHRFWEWADVLQASLKLPEPGDKRGNWIVYGNDRVLAQGATAEEALHAADAAGRDVVYHRYVTEWPIPGPLEIDVKSFTREAEVPPVYAFNDLGRRAPLGRSTEDRRTYLWRASEADWANSGLAIAEAAREVVLVDGERRIATWAAHVGGFRVMRRGEDGGGPRDRVVLAALVVRDPR